MNAQHEKVFAALNALNISYTLHYHPAVSTVDEAMKYWETIDAAHCKNLFFRNHKGNRHYLVVVSYLQQLNVRLLELKLKQGKLSFASDERMMRYLGLKPGSVSPFGLINDTEKHVHVFIDKKLLEAEFVSFHPNENTATIVIKSDDFIHFIKSCGNTFSFIDMFE